MPFQPGNKEASKRGKNKPFRDALRQAINDAENNPAALLKVAEAMVAKAMAGDVAAANLIADRLDGKVPQAIIGDDEAPPIQIQRIELVAADGGTKD